MRIRWAAKTLCPDPGIDRLREFGVFHQPDNLAGKIRPSIPHTRRLNPAIIHPEDETAFGFVDDLLDVEMSIHAISQRLLQTLQAASGRNRMPGHDPFGLDDGESFPGLTIQLDRLLHSQTALAGQKPESIVRQPILGGILKHVDQLFLGKLRQLLASCSMIIIHMSIYICAGRGEQMIFTIRGVQELPNSKPPVHPSRTGGFAEKKGLLKQRNNKAPKMTG